MGRRYVSRGITEHVDDAGRLHRLDGPAVDLGDNSGHWYVEGHRITAPTLPFYELIANGELDLLARVLPLTVGLSTGREVLDLIKAVRAAELSEPF